MRKMKRMILVAISAVMLTVGAPVLAQTESVAQAATVKNGWYGSYYYVKGKKVTGLKKIGKKYYYFNSAGKLVKEKRAYCLKVKGKKHYYNIDAKGVVTEWTGTAKLAAIRLVKLKANLDKVTAKKMKASLLKAFKWSASIAYYDNEKTGLSKKEAADYYGTEAFKKQRGDCDTRAYALYWMAKVLGYEPKYMRGYVLRGNNELGAYAWIEIPISGKTYVFDPTLSAFVQKSPTYSQQYSKAKLQKWGYKFRYGASGTYTYYNSKKKQLTR